MSKAAPSRNPGIAWYDAHAASAAERYEALSFDKVHNWLLYRLPERREGQERHRHPRIRWLNDRLPDLSAVNRLGMAFDLILLSAVWMHVPPSSRARTLSRSVAVRSIQESVADN